MGLLVSAGLVLVLVFPAEVLVSVLVLSVGCTVVEAPTGTTRPFCGKIVD